jgi:hypothetical protein
MVSRDGRQGTVPGRQRFRRDDHAAGHVATRELERGHGRRRHGVGGLPEREDADPLVVARVQLAKCRRREGAGCRTGYGGVVEIDEQRVRGAQRSDGHAARLLERTVDHETRCGVLAKVIGVWSAGKLTRREPMSNAPCA